MSITPQGGSGIGLGLRPLTGLNNVIQLAACETFTLPAGQFFVTPGPYSFLQALDPITGKYRSISSTPGVASFVTSDGGNFRLANLTGGALGALVTNVGSAYTSAPTVTASAGGSTWKAIVGGAINSTVTITGAGAGYNYPPQLVVDAPPAGGIPCTMTCTISAGQINAVTVVNNGAGYTVIPTVTVVPDPRESTATAPGPTTAGVLTAALTGSGTITGLLCTNHGTAVTAVPTLTFAGGGGSSAAATAVMCFTATAFAVSNAGVAYGNAQPFGVITTGGVVGGSAGTTTNPQFDKQIMVPRMANIAGTTTSGSVITATGQVVIDGGMFQAVPTGLVLPSGTAALPTTTAIVTITVGGVSDQSIVQPIT